jgi:NAD(P)-dependent dehydrogenase (short-subunit alcohol dehydrogenase family)
MAREGASVVVADLNRTEAERVAGELDAAVAVEVDVSDEESVARMVKAAVESFGGLDVLHNNATDSSLNAVDTDIVTPRYGRLRPARRRQPQGPVPRLQARDPVVQASLQNYPMPRLCAPEDVAKALLFLASDEAAYVNAATLMVDGGATVYMTNAQLRRADNAAT